MANGRFGPEEWTARVELAAAYRIFDMLGWTELIYNHISLRVPGPETHFLINPFGLHYSEVTASNLVKIDLAGNVVGESKWPINPAGFTPHATIHRAIAEAHCVMHTHTTAGLAVACLEDGLSMSNFYSAQLHGKVAYHDFEGITVHGDEGPRLAASLADKRVLVLRNHGLLVTGTDVFNAFRWMWTLQRACEVQLAAGSIPGANVALSDAVRRSCGTDAREFEPRESLERMLFDSVLRRSGIGAEQLV